MLKFAIPQKDLFTYLTIFFFEPRIIIFLFLDKKYLSRFLISPIIQNLILEFFLISEGKIFLRNLLPQEYLEGNLSFPQIIYTIF